MNLPYKNDKKIAQMFVLPDLVFFFFFFYNEFPSGQFFSAKQKLSKHVSMAKKIDNRINILCKDANTRESEIDMKRSKISISSTFILSMSVYVASLRYLVKYTSKRILTSNRSLEWIFRLDL